MVPRPFWVERIERAWREAPIVWLAGVRRVGKTTLAQSLGPDRIQYVNCDLPVVADMIADPELFYRNCDRPVVVFDEIHQLRDPSRLLKIGADLFPNLRILATGSSTLAASEKFRDTLTGRKRLVHLAPVLWNELPTFNATPLLRRLYHGGLPEALLAETKNPAFYREWTDSFFARDIQRLFAFRAPEKFTALFEYVLKQSGGIFEVARAASVLGVSRATVDSHTRALETTHAVTLLRPFHGGGQKELAKAPKLYAFDTGLVSFGRGWDPLRPEDYGLLWEHVVLEYLQAHAYEWKLHYWRDAMGREIDFIIPRSRDQVDAIECKWDPKQLDPTALKVFRSYYPHGANYLVSPIGTAGYAKRVAGLEVFVCNPDEWWQHAHRPPAGTRKLRRSAKL
jgi:predicted AAA+ superfamily ATPase